MKIKSLMDLGFILNLEVIGSKVSSNMERKMV